MILRSVHSAVNHTPTHLLKEVILVDDNSDEGEGRPAASERGVRVSGGSTPAAVTGAPESLPPGPGACLQGARCFEEDVGANTGPLDRPVLEGL